MRSRTISSGAWIVRVPAESSASSGAVLLVFGFKFGVHLVYYVPASKQWQFAASDSRSIPLTMESS
jgi:hypothetical protein